MITLQQVFDDFVNSMIQDPNRGPASEIPKGFTQPQCKYRHVVAPGKVQGCAIGENMLANDLYDVSFEGCTVDGLIGNGNTQINDAISKLKRAYVGIKIRDLIDLQSIHDYENRPTITIHRWRFNVTGRLRTYAIEHNLDKTRIDILVKMEEAKNV